MSEPRDALYNAARVILWVEDRVTAAYLDALWGHDPRLKLYVGGGHENLRAVVEDANRAGYRHVLGLRDRDFGPTNRHRWRELTTFELFALETFEIECFLLDPAALQGRLDEDTIRAALAERANALFWWMACRKVLADLRDARQVNFPAHPKPAQVADLRQAEDLLLNNLWVTRTAPELPARVHGDRLRIDLEAAHRHYADSLRSKTWTRDFSGKEVIAGLFKRFTPRAANLEDLAKLVAGEQRRRGSEPAELVELRDILLARA